MNGFVQGKPKYSEKTCSDATLSTTNPTCQTRARTRPAAMGSQRLTASAMARPQFAIYYLKISHEQFAPCSHQTLSCSSYIQRRRSCSIEKAGLSWNKLRNLCNFFNSHSGGWSPNWVHSARRPLVAHCTCPGWLWGWRIWWNENLQGNPKYSEKTYPSATLSTTNPTLRHPGANPDLRCGKPANNRLSYGAAQEIYVSYMMEYDLWFSVCLCYVINTFPWKRLSFT
jgi:hypothetical protein